MILDTIAIGSGLSVTLLDQTRHYFGGYYHVKVLAFCDIPLMPDYFENEADFDSAVRIMGESVRFERVLEKMAVPESGIESVRSQLTLTFQDTTRTYLSVPDFAPRFVRSEFQKRITQSSRMRIPRV